MTNKVKSAEMVSKFVHVLRCSICNRPMEVMDLKSLVCLNEHTFDLAKQGYINLLTRSVNSHYDKELFKARKSVIKESDLFSLLHEKILEIINEYLEDSMSEIMLFDAGCGEGSHLQKIIDNAENLAVTGIGLDISKDGIKMAASNYKESIWLVGDLANSPLADQSCHVILNILSPANYKEFQRILVSDGIVLKIVPRSHYLKELREALFDNTDKKSYKNDKTVALFNHHFHLLDVINLRYTKKLTQTELIHLVQMSPLAWNISERDMNRIINQGISAVTVDLDILIGINKKTKGDRY
ncbi:putative RNA methyltransferase [Ornithinibacillus bavariensis]|uniref:putative RNA methyltransferase n=1 Tax=Ornithinibacillus bavariensis TaxID=545502 RepID=UPI000ED488EB|nr:SAM-dependent methyltransferase [Ornithinibacillus sp.]